MHTTNTTNTAHPAANFSGHTPKPGDWIAESDFQVVDKDGRGIASTGLSSAFSTAQQRAWRDFIVSAPKIAAENARLASQVVQLRAALERAVINMDARQHIDGASYFGETLEIDRKSVV